MITRFRAQFDGKTLVPLEPVDLPTGHVLELEVREVEMIGGLPRGSPQLILRVLDSLPKLTREDVEELERAIRENELPAQDERSFDEPK
jgi:hypothetical protein